MRAEGYNSHLVRLARVDMIKREELIERREKEKAEKALAEIKRKEEARQLMEQLAAEERALDAKAEEVRQKQRGEREAETRQRETDLAAKAEVVRVAQRELWEAERAAGRQVDSSPAAAQQKPGLIERLRDRQVEVISIEPGGRYRTREVGVAAKLKTSFWMMKIIAFLAIFVFHDSIIGYVAEKLGENLSIVGEGVYRGYRSR